MSEDSIIQPDDDLLRQQQEAAQAQQGAEQGDPTTQVLGEAAVVQTQQEGGAVEQNAVIDLAGAGQPTAPEVAQEEPPQFIPHESEPQPEPDTSKRVDDEDIAREMAYYGYSERTDAAEIRRSVTAEKEFKDRLQEIITDPRYLDPSLRHKLLVFIASHPLDGGRPDRPAYILGKYHPDATSAWAIKELKKLEASGEEANPDISWSRRLQPNRAAEDVLDGTYDPEAPYREDELTRAKEMDQRADVREEWVRFIRENPITEEYKEAHPNFTFEPWEMQQLEGLVDLRNGQEWSERLLGVEHLDDPSNVSFAKVVDSLQAAVEALAETGGDTEAELLERYQTIIVDPETKLGDLMDLNKSIRQRHNEIIEGRAAERRRVLQDVKSGVASRPPEPTDLQQAA